ncbi:MAG TPA: adenylate/guanylate cyclase domain-containing protein [Chloroflexi bacterium]|nr:adenylate/guanylate cyclase domain-containing protein [Chloroflexota bacterium]
MADTIGTGTAASLSEELDYVRRLTADLRDVLKQQREILRARGFRLPPGTTTTLNDIIRRVEAASKRLEVLEHELDQYRALADIAALINSSLDLTHVLNQAMDTIIKLTGAERGYLMLRDEETGEMEFRIARNVDRKTIDSSEFEVSRSVVQRVAESGEPILTTNAQEDTRFQHAESVVSYSLRSILCVPLTVRGEVTGVVYTDNKIQAGLFTEQTRDLLMAFANQAAVAIENARLFARITSTLEAISEMKNLQDNIFASIASGVITTDTEERITLINRRAQQILNLMEKNLVGANLRDVLPTLDARFDRVIEEVKQADQRLTGIEFEADLPARGHVNLSMNFSPLKDAHEQTQGVAIVLDDLTEIKRREAQIAGVRRYLPAEVVDGIRSAAELKLGGTRQVITILFADIRGFSTFSEKIEPERLVEIINTYMTIASDAIHLQQGVIDKFMGDAVMALYNTPLRPQEDHALRAVRSAAAMIADMRAYHEIVSEEDRLEFGIGIHTGEAVVGNVGSPERLDYTAMGDSVNLAKRLQEVALPSQILLSEETYQLVADHVEVRELEPIQVKGRSQYTRVFELVSVH